LLERDDVDSVLSASEGAIAPDVVAHLATAKVAYLDAAGAAKAALRRSIEALESRVFEALIDDGILRLERRLTALSRLETAPNLFGHPRGLKPEEQTLRDGLEGRIEQLRSELEALATGRGQPFFAFGLHFAEVVRDGGFDVIVGNPPWVRPHRQSRELKSRIRKRYQSCHRSTWATGARLGRSLKAGQVDLSAVFIERALQLVAPGGVVSMLVPAKLFAALGAGG